MAGRGKHERKKRIVAWVMVAAMALSVVGTIVAAIAGAS